MAGLPNLEQTRSLSRWTASRVTVVFKDGTNIYFARQRWSMAHPEGGPSCPVDSPTLGPSPPASADLRGPSKPRTVR